MTTTTATTITELEEPPMTTTEATIPLTTEAPNDTGPRPAGQLAAVLRSEWIKATTVRVNMVLLATSAIVGLLTSWATAAFVTDEGLTFTDVFIAPTLLTAVLAAVAGILLFTTEVQHGTLAGALTAHPSRWPVVGGKALVAAGFGLLLGVVGMAAGVGGALAGGIEVGDTSGVLSTVTWGLLYTVGSALLGLGVGMVVRHSAGAVSGLLVWWLVVEALIVQFAPAKVVWFVPFDTGFRTLGIESDFDVPEVAAAGLSNPAHAAIFWGYVIVAVVLGTALLLRRDAD
jgi:ABC-2 type transport system permease protein